MAARAEHRPIGANRKRVERPDSAIVDIGAITTGDDAARHVSPQHHGGHWGGLQSRDDTVMPRPAPSHHHGAVAVMSEGNDASTPKVPDANKAAAAMRPVEASTACLVPEEIPAAAPTTAATMNAPPTP